MPSTKRWYFDPKLGGLRGVSVVRDGKDLGEKYGPICDVNVPLTRKLCAQAKDFLDQAVQIHFKNGTTIVLNRCYFEWSKNDFSRKFRNLNPNDKAVQFVETWNLVTKYSQDRGFMVPRPESSVETENVASQVSDISSEEGGSQPKQIKLTEPVDAEGMHTNPMDDTILSKKIGIYMLPVANLDEPDRETRLIRSLDEQFLRNLVEKMENDPSGPGVPPIAVSCTDVDETGAFAERLKDVYKYEVLGGQHTSAARTQLNKKYPENPLYRSILAEVYVGLSDDEALRLASRHNVNGHFVHKMTHRDYVEACRSKLFVMASAGPDCETPSPTQDWKKVCARCILPEDMSRSNRDNVYCQASFSKEAWLLAIKIMDLFEEGEIKGQKLSTRQLTSKPEFKQQYLQPVQCLPDSFKLRVLTSVAEKDMSFSELKRAASDYRAEQAVQKAFCKCTNTTWEGARRRYPTFTTQDRLRQFLDLNFSKQMPQAFVAYCQAAMHAESCVEQTAMVGVYTHHGVHAYVVEKDILTLSYSDIRNVCPSFMGAHLFLAHVPKDWGAEQLQKLVYTSRQVNTIPEGPLNLSNIAIICEVDQTSIVKDAVQHCYDHLEVAYWHNSAAPAAGISRGFIPSVGVVVIGHFSLDGELRDEQYCIPPAHNIFLSTGEEDLLKKIIAKLSHDGHVVLDALSENGLGAMASMSEKKGCCS